MDFAMPYMIQTMCEMRTQLDQLKEAVETRLEEQKEKSVTVEQPLMLTGPGMVGASPNTLGSTNLGANGSYLGYGI